MSEEEIIDAVYKAAYDYINSVVPPKMIQDLDISVAMDDADISIDIQLVTTRPAEVDQRTVEEAVKVASEKADELMAGRS
jgi:hypothetical protein